MYPIKTSSEISVAGARGAKIYLQDPGNTIADPYQQKRICLNLFLIIWQTCGKDELR